MKIRRGTLNWWEYFFSCMHSKLYQVALNRNESLLSSIQFSKLVHSLFVAFNLIIRKWTYKSICSGFNFFLYHSNECFMLRGRYYVIVHCHASTRNDYENDICVRRLRKSLRTEFYHHFLLAFFSSSSAWYYSNWLFFLLYEQSRAQSFCIHCHSNESRLSDEDLLNWRV